MTVSVVAEGNEHLHQIPSRPVREHANPTLSGDPSSDPTTPSPAVHIGPEANAAALGAIS